MRYCYKTSNGSTYFVTEGAVGDPSRIECGKFSGEDNWEQWKAEDSIWIAAAGIVQIKLIPEAKNGRSVITDLNRFWISNEPEEDWIRSTADWNEVAFHIRPQKKIVYFLDSDGRAHSEPAVGRTPVDMTMTGSGAHRGHVITGTHNSTAEITNLDVLTPVQYTEINMRLHKLNGQAALHLAEAYILLGETSNKRPNAVAYERSTTMNFGFAL